MAVLLELVLQSTYAGQQCINRFNYLSTSSEETNENSAALVQAFGCIWDGTEYPAGLPFAATLLVQNTGVVYQFASCRDVYNPLDFEEVPFVNPAVGGHGSQGGSPFDAFGMRTTRTRLDVGRGYKRLVGTSEDIVDAEGLLTSAALTAIQGVADTYTAVLTQMLDSVSYTLTPVIAGKQRYNSATGLPDPAGNAYRYYPTYAEQADFLSIGAVWEAYPDVRSQVSRRRGHGR